MTHVIWSGWKMIFTLAPLAPLTTFSPMYPIEECSYVFKGLHFDGVAKIWTNILWGSNTTSKMERNNEAKLRVHYKKTRLDF
jgi:hypothetical protein